MVQAESRKTRHVTGRVVLQERDLSVLRWIGEQYAVTVDHLAKLLARFPPAGDKGQKQPLVPGRLGPSAVSNQLARWERADLVRTKKLASWPLWVYPTRRGLAEAGLPARGASSWFYEPVDDSQTKHGGHAHRYQINTVRLYLEEAYPEGYWVCERTIAQRLAQAHSGESQGHRPDGELHHAEGTVAIEVELSAKERGELAAILRQLLGNETYAAVWYFVTRPARTAVTTALALVAPAFAEAAEKVQCIDVETLQ